LLSGFLLLIFVFARRAAKGAGSSVENQLKLAAIRASWRRAIGKA
jgi:hypothetical protein